MDRRWPCCAKRGQRTGDDKGQRTKDEQSEGKRAADEVSTDILSPDKMSAQIDDLDARIARLGAYIDARHDECAVSDLCRLLDLHSMMLSRVTRMRQVQDALNGQQTQVMVWVNNVLGLIIGDQKVLPKPGRRKRTRRKPDRAPSPWVQSELNCAPEGEGRSTANKEISRCAPQKDKDGPQ